MEMESWIMFLCEVCYNRPSLGLCIISRCQTRSSVLPFFFPGNEAIETKSSSACTKRNFSRSVHENLFA